MAVLLTGDISADIEREILPHLTRHAIRDPQSRAPRQPHLVIAGTAVRVATAVRADQRGTREHVRPPGQEVLRRLEAIGAMVLRTDRHGEISVETDGRQIKFTTFQGR